MANGPRADTLPATQFYQTVHQKPLIGGALSRISRREIERQHQFVTIRHLVRLSEGHHLSPRDLEEVKQRAPGFVDRSRLGYLVIDVGRTPPALRDLAIEAYGLVKLGESDGRELYVPTVGGHASLSGVEPERLPFAAAAETMSGRPTRRPSVDPGVCLRPPVRRIRSATLSAVRRRAARAPHMHAEGCGA